MPALAGAYFLGAILPNARPNLSSVAGIASFLGYRISHQFTKEGPSVSSWTSMR